MGKFVVHEIISTGNEGQAPAGKKGGKKRLDSAPYQQKLLPLLTSLSSGDMSLDQRLELAVRGTEEVVTKPELRELLRRRKLKVYCGYEPSGKIHFGHALSVWKLADFQKLGAEVTVLFADLHAFLNDKGSLEDIRRVAEYNKHCFLALGLDPKRTRFLLGSDYQLEPDFSMDVLKLSVGTTLHRARRSMDMIARHLENPDVAQVLYPLMQAVDMARLGVNVAIGGIDQRKVHMIAREKLPALGYDKPVCVHMPLIHGLDGASKMSSTKGNFIALDDSPATIKRKVGKAYCPPKSVEGNPVVEYATHVVLPLMDTLKVKREKKHGGPLELSSVEELRKVYSSGGLHPADLKPAVGRALIEVLEPVRRYFRKHPKARRDLPSVA